LGGQWEPDLLLGSTAFPALPLLGPVPVCDYLVELGCPEHARPSEEELCQLMRDCSVMVGLRHENLSPLIATCLDGAGSPLARPLKLVYVASSDDDNLKLFLQQCRHSQVYILIRAVLGQG